MKKIILLLLILISLCGCKAMVYDDPTSAIEVYYEAKADNADVVLNNHSTYYSCYIPSDVVIKEIDSTYLVLNYLENDILVNINVSKIVNSIYWQDNYDNKDGFFSEEKLFFSKEGYFADYDGDFNAYHLDIYLYDDTYLISVETDDLKLFSFVKEIDLVDVTNEMYYLANVFSVNETKIVDSFTDKNVIDYTRKQIDLFEYIVPSSGVVDDLLK